MLKGEQLQNHRLIRLLFTTDRLLSFSTLLFFTLNFSTAIH